MSSPHLRSYADTRRLVVLGGTVLLAAIATLAWAHGVDPVEAAGAALYVPVFLAATLLGPWEGSAVAILAAAIYLGLRIPAIKVVGFDSLAGLLLPRVVSYVVFGAVIGFAAQWLNASLSHLERHDLVDAATRLHNARWFLEATDAEINRVQRALDPVRGFLGYGSVFSVVVVTVDADAIHGREGNRLLGRIGDELSHGLRVSDRPVHAVDHQQLFALLLPGTPAEGAAVVGERAAERIRPLLGDNGAAVTSSVISYPEDAEALEELRERLRRIDVSEQVPA
jgi:GGDEF domain-containing protein